MFFGGIFGLSSRRIFSENSIKYSFAPLPPYFRFDDLFRITFLITIDQSSKRLIFQNVTAANSPAPHNLTGEITENPQAIDQQPSFNFLNSSCEENFTSETAVLNDPRDLIDE